jgi:hypothetical protein
MQLEQNNKAVLLLIAPQNIFLTGTSLYKDSGGMV